MKKMVIVLSTIAVIGLMMGFSCITVNAEEYSEYARKWLEKQREQQEKYMDELEADGNLTQEAIDSISKGTSKRKPNHKSGSRSDESNSSTGESSTSSGYSGPGRGWVYSVDELHVVGLPTGENGYTKPGWYGDID